MMKAAIYCRLSDEDRNKFNHMDDSESIQNQKTMLTQHAISKGWEIYKIYSDDDYSGLDKYRPQWNEMIRDAEHGEFNIVLCKSQSRFTRDLEYVEKYLHNKFVEWGIRFIGLVDNADTSNKGNKKQRQIMGLTNEWYCEEISENIRAVFDMKRSKGEFIGSFATYGYLKDSNNKNKLIIDEQAADVVKMIYQWYLEGYGSQHIAFMLNEKSIPNPTKYKQLNSMNFVNASLNNNLGLWNKTTVKRILKNEVFIGNMIQGKRKKISYKSKLFKITDQSQWFRVNDTHDPIIDKSTFYEVQRRIKKRQKSSGEGQAHILATKVKCADCGNIMHKLTSFSGHTKLYSYLRCKIYASTGKNSICSSHSIRLDVLLQNVAEKLRVNINKFLDETNVCTRLMNENDVGGKINLLNNDLLRVNKHIQTNAQVLKNLYIDKVKGIITEVDFFELSKSFSEEKESLHKRKAETEKNIDEVNKKLYNFDYWMEVTKEYKNFKELTHSMVNLFIDYIEIGEKNRETGEQNVNIHWMF